MEKATKLLSLMLSVSLASQMISIIKCNATKDSITFYDVKNNILDLKAYDAELDTNHDGNMNVFDVIRANKTLIQEESYTDLKEKVYMLETQIESLYQKLSEKTDAEEGKQLSSNDYTDEEKQKLEVLNNYDDTQIKSEVSKISGALSSKVDKEEGKQLSSNNYTDEEKQKLEGLNNYNDTQIKTEVSELSGSLSSKVDKEEGKQLSSNDYTNEEKQKLESLNNYDDSIINEKLDLLVQTAYEEKKKIESSIENKIDKEEGKQLSSNDFTDEEKQKIKNVEEYKLDAVEFSNSAYNINNEFVDTNKYYLSNNEMIYIGKGNLYRVCVKDGWEVNPNYHSTSNSFVRTGYEPHNTESETFVAKDDYVRLLFVKRDNCGNMIDLTKSDKPDARLFIVNNGKIDPVDFGAKYDGVTDCTEAFQTCLDFGSLIIHEEGTAICRSLMISQNNTTIDLSKNFTVKLADATNDPLIYTIGSKHRNNEIETIDTITGLSINGGIWDGNGDHQGQSLVKGSVITKDHTEVHWWSMMLLLDVNKLSINNITLKNPLKFGAMIGNCDEFSIRDIFCDYYTRDSWSMDGLHFGGPISNGLIDHIYGQTHDDMIGINVDGDYNEDADDMPRKGSAKHIVIRNVNPDNCYRAVRLLCGNTYKCDDILIDGVQGTANFYSAIHISNWAENANYGTITLRNINVRCPVSVIQIGENENWRQAYTEINNLIVDAVTINPLYNDSEGLIRSYGGGKIKNLSLTNIFISGSNAPCSPLINGKVETAMITNINVDKPLKIFSDVDNALISNAILNGSLLYEKEPEFHSESNIIY